MMLATATHPASAQTATAPRLTLAEIFRRYAWQYRHTYGWRLTPQQDRALREIEVCRTRVLGGHEARCSECGQAEYHWNSCRNKHCPRCSGYRRRQWYRDRLAEMLATDYAHVVYTLPETLSELAEHNGKLIYDLLFRAASQALLHVARTWQLLQVAGIVLRKTLLAGSALRRMSWLPWQSEQVGATLRPLLMRALP